MNFFIFRFIVVFLVLVLSQGYAKSSDVKTVGTSFDESFIYKMKSGRKASDGENDVFSALKNVDKKSKSNSRAKSSSTTSTTPEYFVVAKVNNDVITNVDILNAIKFVFFSSGKKFEKNKAKLMVKQVVNTMIDDRLRQQYAKLLNINVSDSDVYKKVLEIAADNGVSIEKLRDNLESQGISLDILKKNIKSRMLLQFIANALTESHEATKSELAEAKAKAEKEIKHKRYRLSEIFFRVDDKKSAEQVKANANSALELIGEGFSFYVMAATLSQGMYSGNVGDTGWMREGAIEQPVLDVVRNLSPGKCSDVIRTKTGYKIICLLDVAEPGKTGSASADYDVIRASLKYKGDDFTPEKTEEVSNKVENIIGAKSISEYKDRCINNNVVYEETRLTHPDPYELEAISKSRVEGTPVVMQSRSDEDKLDILIYVNEIQKNAVAPTEKELEEQLSEKKLEEEFSRNFKRLKSTSHVEIDEENLNKVLK